MTTTTKEDLAAEKEIIEKLGKVVEEAFASVAKMTRLQVQEVIHIVEEVDVVQLRKAMQEAFKKISHAVDLDSAVITQIFKENSTATIDEIVTRLHEHSKTRRHRL
jgi:hypothetical protein